MLLGLLLRQYHSYLLLLKKYISRPKHPINNIHLRRIVNIVGVDGARFPVFLHLADIAPKKLQLTGLVRNPFNLLHCPLRLTNQLRIHAATLDHIDYQLRLEFHPRASICRLRELLNIKMKANNLP